MRQFLLILILPVFVAAQDHLLITEVMVPASTEQQKAFIEIYNPTSEAQSLNNVYLANYNEYYKIVNGDYPTNAGYFAVKFPDVEIASGEDFVVAFNGSGFADSYSSAADFEIESSDATVNDMVSLYVGSALKLESSGMMVLFRWDGSSDLVQDIDYLPWGVSFFNSRWVDKSGISIDGPDAGTDSSTYKEDTPTTSQTTLAAPTGGKSLQRIGIVESDEVTSDGNGIGGHDETSESWTSSFTAMTPTPGSFSEVPGDGTGSATVAPTEVKAGDMFDLTFNLSGTAGYVLDRVQIKVPDDWTWSQSSGDVQLSGSAFSSSTISVNANQVLIENAQLTDTQTGQITLTNMTAPSVAANSVFNVETSVAGGNLTSISASPTVSITSPLTIADIQDNYETYSGQEVTLTAIVAIGAGVTSTTWTDVYIQDNSGRGINVYRAGEVVSDLVRGAKIQITGTVDEYNGTTEITNFTYTILSTGNEVPAVSNSTIDQVSNIDLEGTFIETAGVIEEIYATGTTGSNITISDGTGSVDIRIWNSTGIDLSGYAAGDTIGVRAIIDIYNSGAQLLVGYQDDIFTSHLAVPVDGSGKMSVSPSSVDVSQSTTLNFTFTATAEDTVDEVAVTVPNEWSWSGNAGDLTVSGGFASAGTSVDNNVITLSGTKLYTGNGGNVQIDGLTSPAVDTVSTFIIQTAGKNGTLKNITNSPKVITGNGTSINITSIAEIQNNLNTYNGKQVTLQAVVAIGSGVTSTSWTDIYIQDNSGRGINVYRAGEVVSDFVRGTKIQITGTVDDYNGTTEITNFTYTILSSGNDVPSIPGYTINQASNIDLEGTFVETAGVIDEIYETGTTGSNVTISDGTGSIVIRVWSSTGIDLSGYAVGDTIAVRAIIDIYSNAAQLLVGYQNDIFKSSLKQSVDGSGQLSVTPSKVDISASVSLDFTFKTNLQDTVSQFSIAVPNEWTWTANAGDIDLSGGFSAGQVSINNRKVTINGTELYPQNEGSITLHNLTSPSVDTVSVFTAQTAGKNGTLTNISVNPRVVTGAGTRADTISIGAARQLEDGSPITIIGTIVIGAGVLRTDYTSAYIADKNGDGLNVYMAGSIDPDIVRGNKVLMRGTVTKYSSSTSSVVEILDYTTTILQENADLPTPVELKTGDASLVDYEGQYVKIKGTITGKSTTGGGTNIYVSDGSGEVTVRVWDSTNLELTDYNNGDNVIITGVHSIYSGSGQVLLAYQDDISSVQLEASTGISLKLPNKPFAPDQGEELTITYSTRANTHVTLRIYDMGGRLIKTVVDADGVPFEVPVNWDGRDQLGDRVPIGTYICHLLVVDQNSGKRIQKVAPIVVGTILSR